MLFFTPIIVLGICAIVDCFTNDYDLTELVAGVAAFCIVVIVIMLIVLGGCHIGVEGYSMSLLAEREALVYQLENDMYNNDNDLGKKELMDDIKDWNSKISRKQANQDDFWIGIFVPNIYDHFELIELK